MMRGLGTLSRAMLIGFVRDRTALFFTIFFPLMFLVIFGGLLRNAGAPKTDVIEIGPVAAIDQLPPDARTELDKIFKVTKSTDAAAALDTVRKGDADAAIEQRGNAVVVHYSAADAVRSGTVRGIVESLVHNANQEATGVPPRFSVQAEQVEDKSLKAIQFYTPGLLGWAIATGATFGAALTLVNWRKKRILRRLRLAPVSVTSVIGSRVGVSIAIALAQTAIFLGVGMLPYFGLTLSPNWWMVIPMVIAGTLAFLSLGLLAGSFAKTEESANVTVNLLVLPMAFLSGSFFPLEITPTWVQQLSKVFPLRHMVIGMQDVMVRDRSPLSVLPEIGILLGFAAVVSFIASRVFRWDDV
jgi:ABC-2 type transport system permease protein